MKNLVCLAGALLCGASLHAQTQTPPAPQQEVRRKAYVRRLSLGATLSVLGLRLVPDRTTSVVTSSPAFDAIYTTTGASKRVGYGLNLQAAVTDRFAVNASLFLRKAGYKMNSDIIEGTDDPNTSADERTLTVRNEDTRVKFYDLPVLVRYYGKDRHQRGPRWFVEGGGVLRRVSNIRTSIDTTIGTGDKQCCDTTPRTPERRTLRGFVAGAGVQLIDPVGIRVVPEVRYTRWAGHTFNAFSTITERNQIEGMISLTF
ncbi:MAG TPA: hypothetical protein VLE22_25115 [Bryobacteraceae bacterium]|nr:hypothetical protein [Bryobacteraceae bacterium]